MSEKLGADGKPIVEPDPAGSENELENENEGAEGAEKPGGDPVKALHAERGKRKELSKKLKETEDKVAKMQPLVDEYTTILPHLPTLLAAAQKQQAGGGAGGNTNQPDPELLSLAKDFGFEKDDGTPDVERAVKLQTLIDARAGKVVQRDTAPIRQNSATALAQQVRERAYKAVDKEGKPYAKREAIDQVFNSLPPESLADPQAAIMALIVARGLEGPGDDPGDPIHVEGPGRRPLAPAALSEMEKQIAQMRGKTTQEWQKLAGDELPETAGAPGWALE